MKNEWKSKIKSHLDASRISLPMDLPGSFRIGLKLQEDARKWFHTEIDIFYAFAAKHTS